MEEKYCRIKKTDTAPSPPWKVPQSAAHQVTRVPSILPSKFHPVDKSFIHFSFLHPAILLSPLFPLHVIQNFFPLSPAFPSWKQGSPPQGRIAYFSGIVVSERAMFSHRSKVGAEEGSGGDQNKAVSYISDPRGYCEDLWAFKRKQLHTWIQQLCVRVRQPTFLLFDNWNGTLDSKVLSAVFLVKTFKLLVRKISEHIRCYWKGRLFLWTLPGLLILKKTSWLIQTNRLSHLTLG